MNGMGRLRAHRLPLQFDQQRDQREAHQGRGDQRRVVPVGDANRTSGLRFEQKRIDEGQNADGRAEEVDGAAQRAPHQAWLPRAAATISQPTNPTATTPKTT